MPRPRIEGTIDPQLKRDVQQYADSYFGGNMSQAMEHLMTQGLQVQRQEANKGMGYATVAAMTLLILLVLV